MGSKLTFNVDEVEREVQLVRDAPEHRTLYGEEAVPALWLVGDQGVYLMGNDAGREAGRPVVYAVECDPTKLEFDDWWAAKNATFGGDDGVEALPLSQVEPLINAARQTGQTKLVVSLTSDSLSFGTER